MKNGFRATIAQNLTVLCYRGKIGERQSRPSPRVHMSSTPAIIWSCHATDMYREGWIEPPESIWQNAFFSDNRLVRYDCTIRYWEPPTCSAAWWWKQAIDPEQHDHWWQRPHEVSLYTGNHPLLPKYAMAPIRITWKGREIALRGSLAIVSRGQRFRL